MHSKISSISSQSHRNYYEKNKLTKYDKSNCIDKDSKFEEREKKEINQEKSKSINDLYSHQISN